MTKTILSILAILFIASSFGQTKTTNEQDLELTEKNIKRIFSSKPDMCSPTLPTEWTACYNTDSTYSLTDTVRLYSDMYYYLTTQCCYETSWTFTNSTTFNITETNVCQEPLPHH